MRCHCGLLFWKQVPVAHTKWKCATTNQWVSVQKEWLYVKKNNRLDNSLICMCYYPFDTWKVRSRFSAAHVKDFDLPPKHWKLRLPLKSAGDCVPLNTLKARLNSSEANGQKHLFNSKQRLKCFAKLQRKCLFLQISQKFSEPAGTLVLFLQWHFPQSHFLIGRLYQRLQ